MGQDIGDLNVKIKRGGIDFCVYVIQYVLQICFVQDYKEYVQWWFFVMCYEDVFFYLFIKLVVNLVVLYWYNCQVFGKNKLVKMVKIMCEKGNIFGRKINFSVYQSCSILFEVQSNQLVLICNNLSQQVVQLVVGYFNNGNFIVFVFYDFFLDIV